MSEGKVDGLRMVPLPLIEWNSPIRDFADEDIKNMATSLRVHGQIQPIVCKPPNGEGLYEGVCGRLRYEGAKYAKLPEILVRVHEFESEDEVLEWQLVENLHRKELTALQRAEWYKKLYDSRKKKLEGVKDKHIVSGIAGSIESQTGEKKAADTIHRYIQIAKELPKEIKEKIGVDSNFGLEHGRQLLRLKDMPDKQLELADEFLGSVGKGKPLTVRKLKEKVNKIVNPPKPFEPKIFNIWNFSGCDERFGRKGYPGRIPGQIVQNVLYYYTDEGNRVVDPMAGSGTTKDVCNLMNRKCLCYDNNPESFEPRDDIDEHDIRHGFPEKAKNCHLIFLDPPYWRLQKGNYGEGSSSDLTFEEWLEFTRILAENCYKTVKKRGYVTLLIAPFYDEKVTATFQDLPFKCLKFFEEAGFTEVQRVSAPMTSQIKDGRDVKYAKEQRIMLDLNRDLIIFRRD